MIASMPLTSDLWLRRQLSVMAPPPIITIIWGLAAAFCSSAQVGIWV